MNKHIKLLLEGLFDDDIFDDDENINDLSDEVADKLGKIPSLLLCDTLLEVNDYFAQNFDIYGKLKKCMPLIMNENINSFDENNIMKWGSHYYIDVTSEKLGLTIKLDVLCAPTDVTIIYRNKPLLSLYGWYIKYNNNKILWCVSNSGKYLASNIRGASDNATQTKINLVNEYNEKYMFNLEGLIDRFMFDIFTDNFNSERIAEELSANGSVYKVVQKDIDRMTKCLETGKYQGFDLIKEPKKMVARLAALFIVADKQGITDMLLLFNDEIIIKIFTGNEVWNTSRTLRTYTGQTWRNGALRRSYAVSPDYIAVLKALQKFPSIHLKDVIDTYEAYKDKF